MMSIIIATKNRPKHWLILFHSIINQDCHHKYDVYIYDQSSNDKTKKIVNSFFGNKLHIIYIKQPGLGKSIALNACIQLSKSDIIAFTDDDCIVSKTWISEIYTTFQKNPEIACITGNTFPYKNIPEQLCPPTINTAAHVFTTPAYHANIGFGNNFAIRRSILESVGHFKTWLGPGSIGANCEDGEMIVRVLTHGYKIFHDPEMIVYHNKKLSKTELPKQNLIYSCGEMACYGYYSFKGFQFAMPIVWNNVKFCYDEIRQIVKKILFFHWNKALIAKIVRAFFEINYRLKGLMIGWFYSLIDPIH